MRDPDDEPGHDPWLRWSWAQMSSLDMGIRWPDHWALREPNVDHPLPERWRKGSGLLSIFREEFSSEGNLWMNWENLGQNKYNSNTLCSKIIVTSVSDLRSEAKCVSSKRIFKRLLSAESKGRKPSFAHYMHLLGFILMRFKCILNILTVLKIIILAERILLS